MPFYLTESDVVSQVTGLRSVLIVPCRFCPAASLAVRERKPYIELFRRFLRTEAYESFIKGLKRRLQEEGIETSVFDARLPHNFLPCMWTTGRPEVLAKRAMEFEGVLVLGCDAAAEVVRDAIGPNGCRVIEGMEVEGIMSVVPSVSFPLNISLSVRGITRVDMKGPKELVP